MAFAGSNLTGKFPDGKPMVGLINTKKLGKIVNIFGEIFDFSKRLSKEKYHEIGLRMESELVSLNKGELSKWKEGREKGQVGIDKYFEDMTDYKIVPYSPETYRTLDDFGRVYLDWINVKPFITELKDEERQTVLNGLVILFRFLFDTKPLKDVSKVNKE